MHRPGGLETYYRCNFTLMHHYNYTLTDLEEMMPFEREVYQILLLEMLEEKKKLESME